MTQNGFEEVELISLDLGLSAAFTRNLLSQGAAAYLVLAAAHGQGDELVEEVLVLCAREVTHMALQDHVQSTWVPATTDMSV